MSDKTICSRYKGIKQTILEQLLLSDKTICFRYKGIKQTILEQLLLSDKQFVLYLKEYSLKQIIKKIIITEPQKSEYDQEIPQPLTAFQPMAP